ncbi:MAG: hypothetical protein ABFD92_19575 [Planctomycetaceae bacterium]|nr:hypothetical protein [Planctomycetaceae bacterium]
MPRCILLLAALFTLSSAMTAVQAQHGPTADQLEARCAEGSFGGAKTETLPAKWEFSSDGGKTFGPMPAAFGVNPKQILTARATFPVNDPAAVAALWVIFDEPKGGKTPGAFATCGHENVGDGECGASPLWTHVVVTLNGKTPQGPLPGMMYHALPVQTTGLLTKGDNTLTISGPLSALGGITQVALKPLQLIAAVPGKAVIRSGPILGHFGDDFFSVTCRTGLPAAVTVTATPVEPAGAASSATSPVDLYHRLKVTLPKGTRKFTYTVISKLGDMIDSKGPFTVSLPASDAKTLRVVTYGNSRGNYYSWTKASLYADGMLKCKPDIFVHLGQVMEFASWDFQWDVFYLDKFAQLMATVPTYLAPDGGDHTGLTLKLFSTPAADEQNLTWTQAFGPVRLIGIDGIWDWSAASANAKWLERVLKDSREKYILAFNHFPGYSTGQQSRPRGGSMWTPLQQCRDTICPLLGKYKAAAIVSAFDYHYERVEPTPDKGVTSIIAGAGGAKTYRQSNRASANNPFAKTSVFREHTPSFVCFEISDKECVMKAYNLAGKVIDEKTFAPRQ